MPFSIAAYLNFDGDAADALDLYHRVLGGEIEERMHWMDMPGDVPPEMADRLMHSTLKVGSQRLHLSDPPPNVAITRGNAVTVLLQFEDPAELDRVFAALSEGGEVTMPVEDTFWGARFGECTDRFGTRWAMNAQLPQEEA